MLRKISWSGTQALSTTYASVLLEDANKAYRGIIKLGALWAFVNTISGATQATIKFSRDAAGDELITPEYTVDLETGQTTAADGTVIIDYDAVPWIGSSTIYMWIKLNAGTASMTEAALTYEG